MKTCSALVFAIALSSAPAHALTCTQFVVKCRAEGVGKPDLDQKCQAAGDACMKSGAFVAPFSRRSWTNVDK